MDTAQGSQLHTSDMAELEYQVEHLLHLLEKIKAENAALKNKINSLSLERNILQQRNVTAGQEIKNVVRQIREALL